MARGRGHIGRDISNYIRVRDGGICIYCHDEVGQAIDHVFPVKHGGQSIRGNLVLACTNCNMKKKGDLNEEMIAHAFLHLLRVGESLEWVDKIMGQWGVIDP